MKILTLHNEAVLKEMETAINQADRQAGFHPFTELEEALRYLKAEKVDAFMAPFFSLLCSLFVSLSGIIRLNTSAFSFT